MAVVSVIVWIRSRYARVAGEGGVIVVFQSGP